VTLVRFIHFIALFWMIGGIGNTLVPIYRAWFEEELHTKTVLLSAAQQNYTTWLLPGVIATGITGYLTAGVLELNVISTGWLAAMGVVWMLQIFILLPLLGIGLRRVRYLALQADKQGETTDELRDALADNAPLVFGVLIIISVFVMTWLPVFKPF
jgi:hypothetical protein